MIKTSRMLAVCLMLGLLPSCAQQHLPAALADTAGPAPSPELKTLIDKEYPSLEALYESIHQNPELSWMEEKTAARVAQELRNAGYQVTEHVGRNGVVAVMENGPGKVLLLRTELDALPVTEQTGAPYASKATTKNAQGETVGVMHACGHDVHITSLIGAARVMAAMKDHWHGTLLLVGQPAEETVDGAQRMLDERLYQRFPKPDFCLAQHVDSELELGKVGWISGYAFANSDFVDITIRGVGGHGAMPHMTKDPIVIAAETILALQTIASREIKATEPVVVTVGSIHGGTKHNIIPDEVKLQLTVRTYKESVRKQTLAAIERIARGIAISAGVPDDRMPIVKVDHGNAATYNTPELVDRVTPVFRKLLGDENVVEREPTMGAEDFGRFGDGAGNPKIPTFMWRLGSIAPQRVADSRKQGGAPLPSLHSSHYLPERETIRMGVTLMTTASLDLLK